MRRLAGWLDQRARFLAIVSLATGLVLSGASRQVILLAVGVALLAAATGIGPRGALLVALALAVGGALGTARLGAIDSAGERMPDGEAVAGRGLLLEAPRPGLLGPVAELRMISGAAHGGRFLARLPPGFEAAGGEAVGAELRLSGEFRLPRAGSGGFDFAAHLRRQGIQGELAVREAHLTGRRRGGLSGLVDRVRRRSDVAVAAGLAPTSAALARGMVLGADEAVPDGVRTDFEGSGLAHVLAVSGQNVLLLCVLALPLLAAAGLSHRARKPVLIGLIALYVPLAGAGPSIQRAGVMGAASLMATALARPASRPYALGLAACVTLALNPRAYGDVGWQLSFAAVAGILLLAPGIARALGPLPRVLSEAIALTIAATLATAPLLAHHFGTLSLVGLPANLLALPLVAPIMWLGMLRAAVGQAIPAGGPLGQVATAANSALAAPLAPLLGGLESLAARFADVPGGQAELALGGLAEVALAYALLAISCLGVKRAASRADTRASAVVACLRRLPRGRRVALVALLAVASMLVLARGLAPPGPPDTLTVSFLDVGQGDATLVQHPDGSAVLFDGGPPEGGVVRLLRRAGVRRLSALVVTHASRDHHGGLAEVVERIPVDVLLDGGDSTTDPSFRSIVARARERGARVIEATAPLSLGAGSLEIELLSPRPRPPGPEPEDPNPRAVVATVGSGGFELLLSGDAESETLLALALPDVDAIKVPHHGSADPGLPEVLDRVEPEVASIPVGPNTYGHPAPSTLRALAAAGVATWRNDRNGTVRVEAGPDGVHVYPERGEPVSGAP